MAFTEQDAEAIKSYAGTYKKEIFTTLRDKMTIMDDLTVEIGVKNHKNLTKLKVKKGIMKHRRQFDAADDDLQYTGRRLSVNLLKRDFLIDPYKYRDTWMSEYMKPGVDNRDIPFPEFTAQAINKELASEINTYAYLATDDGGDGLTIEQSFDGLGTLIAKAINDENKIKGSGLVPVATGEITKANAVSKFEMMFEELPTAYADNGVYLYCSNNLWRKYLVDYRERYGKYTDKESIYFIDGSDKVQIKPCSWMGNSQRIIATPKENLLVGVDGLGDMDNISVFYKHETIEWRVNLALGFQIQDLEAIKVSDQA